MQDDATLIICNRHICEDKQANRKADKQASRQGETGKDGKTDRTTAAAVFLNFETPIFGRTINNHTEENCLTTTKPTKVVSAVGFYQPLPVLMHRCTDAPVCIIHYALETGCIIYSLFFPVTLTRFISCMLNQLLLLAIFNNFSIQ